MLSVGWDGRLFDCDFNQMLDLPLAAGLPQSVADLTDEAQLMRMRGRAGGDGTALLRVHGRRGQQLRRRHHVAAGPKPVVV